MKFVTHEKYKMFKSLLLSFILPSHMVVPKRILVDISFTFHLSILHNSQEALNNIAMDININTSKD